MHIPSTVRLHHHQEPGTVSFIRVCIGRSLIEGLDCHNTTPLTNIVSLFFLSPSLSCLNKKVVLLDLALPPPRREFPSRGRGSNIDVVTADRKTLSKEATPSVAVNAVSEFCTRHVPNDVSEGHGTVQRKCYYYMYNMLIGFYSVFAVIQFEAR